MVQRLQRLVTAPLQPLGEALFAEGHGIIVQSQELVPVDTGLLRSTARVERPLITRASVEVEVSFGAGGIAPYAAIVHFDTEAFHPVGQSHYLQQPLFQATNGFAQRIANDLKGALTI